MSIDIEATENAI